MYYKIHELSLNITEADVRNASLSYPIYVILIERKVDKEIFRFKEVDSPIMLNKLLVYIFHPFLQIYTEWKEIT